MSHSGIHTPFKYWTTTPDTGDAVTMTLTMYNTNTVIPPYERLFMHHFTYAQFSIK